MFVKDSKNNFDKIKFELIDPNFNNDFAKVLTIGAKKYGIDNYKRASKKDQKEYIGAIHRHLNSWERGYKFDHETKLNHMAHISANAMFLYYFDLLKRVT